MKTDQRAGVHSGKMQSICFLKIFKKYLKHFRIAKFSFAIISTRF